MVLSHGNRAEFPTLTVAWAAPDSHRTSSASIANDVQSASFSLFPGLRANQAKACTLNLENTRHSHIPARRIAVEQDLDTENVTYVLGVQDGGGRPARRDLSVF